MSRGPGRVQVAIAEAVRAEPDNAFTVTDLCERIYGTLPTKKHRVSTLRAMLSVAAASPEFGVIRKHGVGAVLFCAGSPASVRLANAKLGAQHLLRRKRWSNGDAGFWYYRGKQHYSRGTFSYKEITTHELDEIVRAELAAADDS